MIRVAITGPESTGKSWLAENLAGRYHAAWVPEYAREYLEKLGQPYNFDDILEIAKGQLASEERAAAGNNLLFCDTELIVTRIWCRVKYGTCHSWIEEKLLTHAYDLYLLCDIDLPWQFDPLREHPEMRADLLLMYRQELTERGINFRIVSGTGNERLLNAARQVDELLRQKQA